MLIAGSCTPDKVMTPVEPTPGHDVVFGASLTPQTRTEYGEEDKINNVFPIKWVNTDEMLVMSPQCSPAFGKYKVGFTGTSQSAAGNLVKQGEAGVQWGSDATADFFSVYPYNKVVAQDPANRKVTMRMPHIQNDYIKNIGTTESPKYVATADMEGGFLYAQNYGVQNGSEVQLGYTPFSTALRFTLKGPASADGKDVQIQYIKITAPENVQLAGDVDVTFGNDKDSRPTIISKTPDGENSYNVVYIYSSYQGASGGGYLTLNNGESIELNAFFMIDKPITIDKNWEIEVVTLMHTYKMSLAGTSADGKNMTLVPGQIHRMKPFPALSADNTSEWEVSNWMVNIPRNTYISEISIPGSWNSLNKDAQGTNPSITAQYSKGARAFHLDCRYKRKWESTGILSGHYVYDLGIADGGTTSAGSTNKYMTSDATPTFNKALSDITNCAKDDEYMVVICTFAQNSGVPSGRLWYNDVSMACTSNEKVIEASTLSENSTVGDMLGKVIVIVNMEGNITGTSLPKDSKCFFVNAPLTLSKEMFANASSFNSDKLYANQMSTNISFFNTQAQISTDGNAGSNTSNRGYAPTLNERKFVAQGILDWSCDNYGQTNYKHSDWIYMGLGGYFNGNDNSYGSVADNMNNWILGRVNNMSATPTGSQTNFFPVGIVLMNMVTNTTYGAPVMKEILLLNSRYQKAYDKDKPAWPNSGQQNSPDKYAASHVYGGDAWMLK